MNESRYRRPQIRARARLAIIKRVAREKKWKKDVLLPSAEPLIEGRIFINYNDTIEPETTSGVWIESPLRGIFRKLNDMQKYGFWAPRPQNQELLFFPAGSILQVALRIKENYGE